MARALPTIAGRPVPYWMGVGIRLSVFALLGVLGSQLAAIEASASSAPAVEPRLSYSSPTLEARPPYSAPTIPPPAAVRTAARPAFGNMQRLVVGRQLLHGDYVWHEDGAPTGPLSILVDLSAQTLSVFRGDREIARTVILYGTEENPTPLGSFPILEKDADHVSNLYDSTARPDTPAPMPWMLRLTNDGIAVHGSNVRYGWASRGCVGVPVEFAARLFALVRVGDRVTIVQGDPASAGPPVAAAPVEIAG
ncbi:MAG: L,D-transpeptidase family protein [Sphingosinicella sp.]